MKSAFTLTVALTALLPAIHALAVDVVALDEPVVTSLNANTVVCSNPETLFMLYESTRLVKEKQPEGSKLPASYFDVMFQGVKENKACYLQNAAYEVKVSGLTLMENNWLSPASVMAYGEFDHPTLNKKMYAPLLALPGLGQYLASLESGSGDAAKLQAEVSNADKPQAKAQP